MKRFSFLTSLIFVFLFALGTSFAAIPQLIPFQAQLNDQQNQNKPLDGTYSMTFELFDSPNGGTPIWVSYQSVNLVNGFLNVYLGEVNPLNNVDFNKQLWLQITVGNGTPYTRTKLGATPYAMMSQLSITADTAAWAQDVVDGVLTWAKFKPAEIVAGGDLTGTYPNPTLANGAALRNITPGSITQMYLAPNVSLPPSGKAGGDLSGQYPDPIIAKGAIKTDRISDGAVTLEKLASNSVGTLNIIDGSVTLADLAPEVKTVGGDLSGMLPNPTVVGFQGVPVSNAAALDGGVYMYNATTHTWVPANAAGDVAGPYNNLQIQAGVVGSLEITDGSIVNDDINANAAIAGTKINPDFGMQNITSTGNLYIDNAYVTNEVTATTVGATNFMGTNGTFDNLTVNTMTVLNGSTTINNGVVLNGNLTGVNNVVLDGEAITAGDLDGFYPSPIIRNLAVTTLKLADGAVVNSKIAADAITTDKILDGTVASADIADGAITTGKIAPGAVLENNIADGAVTNPKLAANSVGNNNIIDGAVTNSKLAAGSVGTNNIIAEAVTNDKIAADAITSAKILDGSIMAADLADGSVTNPKIANDAVTGEKVLDGSLTVADITSGAAPHGAFITSDGLGGAFWSTDLLALPYDQPFDEDVTAFQITRTDGNGDVIVAVNNGTSGTAGKFISSNGDPALWAANTGTGLAFYAEKNTSSLGDYVGYVANTNANAGRSLLITNNSPYPTGWVLGSLDPTDAVDAALVVANTNTDPNHPAIKTYGDVIINSNLVATDVYGVEGVIIGDVNLGTNVAITPGVVPGTLQIGGGLVVTDDFDVTSEATFNDDVTMNAALTVNGLSTFNNNVEVNGDMNVTGTITGGIFNPTDLSVVGNTILGTDAGNTLDVNATSTFFAPVLFKNDVEIDGQLFVDNDVLVSGTIFGDVTGNLTGNATSADMVNHTATNGAGIAPFTFNGSANATVAVDPAVLTQINTNTTNIATLTAGLAAEVTARTAADATLTANLAAEVAARIAADAALSTSVTAEAAARAAADATLQANITAEATARAAADATLQANITAEATARAAADATLAAADATLQANITAEATTRAAADAALAAADATLAVDVATLQADVATLQADVVTLQAADVTLQANITAEAAARAAADVTLQNNIDALSAQEAADVLALQAADATLQANINAEAATRAAADAALASVDTGLQNQINTLTTDLTNEIAARLAADAALASTDVGLQNQINNNTADIVTLFGDVATLQAADATLAAADAALAAQEASDFAFIQTQIASIGTDITNLQAEDINLQTQITQNTTDIATLQTDLATETANRIAGDNALAADITLLQAADVTLQANIDAETAARIAGDAATLASANTYTDAAVAAEAAARTAADAALAAADVTLQNNINAEAAARAAADAILQTNITNEATTRAVADAALAADIVLLQAADVTLQNNINTEAAARIAGDAATLASANTYTDNALTNFVTVPHTWSATQTFTNATALGHAIDANATNDGFAGVFNASVRVITQATDATDPAFEVTSQNPTATNTTLNVNNFGDGIAGAFIQQGGGTTALPAVYAQSNSDGSLLNGPALGAAVYASNSTLVSTSTAIYADQGRTVLSIANGEGTNDIAALGYGTTILINMDITTMPSNGVEGQILYLVNTDVVAHTASGSTIPAQRTGVFVFAAGLWRGTN